MSTFNGLIGLGTHLTDGILVSPLSSAGYAPQPIAVDSILSGFGTNNAPVVFGAAVGSWGTLSYFAVLDQQGNQVIAGPLALPILVSDGDCVQFAGGSLQIAFGPPWASDLVTNAAGQIVLLSGGEPMRGP